MTLHGVRRILVAGVATLGVTLVASAFGLPAELFLAGVFGGGALAAAYLTFRGRIRQTG